MIRARGDEDDGCFIGETAETMDDLPRFQTKTLLCLRSEVMQYTLRHFHIALKVERLNRTLRIEVSNKPSECSYSPMRIMRVKDRSETTRIYVVIGDANRHFNHRSWVGRKRSHRRH